MAFTFLWAPGVCPGLVLPITQQFNFSMGGQGDDAAQSHLTC